MVNWNFSIFCYAAWLDADSFGTAMMAETDRAMLDIPPRVNLLARLTHETQRPDVCTGLAKSPRDLYGVRSLN